MKKTLLVVAILSLISFATGCACTRIEPGYAGIKVNLQGDQKGVEDYPIQTGRVWYNPLYEEIYSFPTFIQRAIWTKKTTEGSSNNDEITFSAKGGINLYADIAIAYKFDAKCIPQLYVEFRCSAKKLTNGYIRDNVRDTFNHFSSDKDVMYLLEHKNELTELTMKYLNDELNPKCIFFDKISIVEKFRFDDERVNNSINSVLEQQQKALEAEAKERQISAEARMRAEQAKGEADAIRESAKAAADKMLMLSKAEAESNKIVNATITEQLIRWRSLEKWDGALPKVTGQGTIPMVNLK